MQPTTEAVGADGRPFFALVPWTPEPRTLARSSDPATSHAAAARVAEFAAGHHEAILTVLREHPAGLTVHEVAAYCRLTGHEVGKRMKELEMRGAADYCRAVESGIVLTRKTPSGRQARVWVAR